MCEELRGMNSSFPGCAQSGAGRRRAPRGSHGRNSRGKVRECRPRSPRPCSAVCERAMSAARRHPLGPARFCSARLEVGSQEGAMEFFGGCSCN